MPGFPLVLFFTPGFTWLSCCLYSECSVFLDLILRMFLNLAFSNIFLIIRPFVFCGRLRGGVILVTTLQGHICSLNYLVTLESTGFATVITVFLLHNLLYRPVSQRKGSQVPLLGKRCLYHYTEFLCKKDVSFPFI